jgi:hypothetical protein
MPRVTLGVQQIRRTGLDPVYVAAQVDGNAFPNSGGEFIHVKNGAGSSINVTVLTTRSVDGQVVTNRVVAVPAGDDRMIGPFQAGNFNQGNGEVWFNYSAVTTITVGVFRV